MTNCDTNALLSAARCFRCVPKGLLGAVRIYLLCEWLKKKRPVGECDAPVATAATNVVGYQFSANWNSVTGALSYRLDVSTSATFASFVGIFDDLDVGLALTSLVTGLTPGTPYYYRVRAVCASGASSNSNTESVTTKDQFYWAPASSKIHWTDIHGSHFEDLATFNASPDAVTTATEISPGTPIADPITDLYHLDLLPALTYLNLDGGSLLTSLDCSNCASLTRVDLPYTLNSNLIHVNFTNCTSLIDGKSTVAYVAGTLQIENQSNLKTVTLSGCSSVTNVSCPANGIDTLLVDGCDDLMILDCGNNALDDLSLVTNSSLVSVTCGPNLLTSLEIRALAYTTFFVCAFNLLKNDGTTTPTYTINRILAALDANGLNSGLAAILAQTPAAPPNAGPPDGVTAKSHLLNISRGPWTVFTD